MSQRKKAEKRQGLGRALEKERGQRRRGLEHDPVLNTKHTIDDSPNMESILDQSDLAQIMSYAELAGRQFSAEKERTVVLSSEIIAASPSTAPDPLPAQPKQWNSLPIPRRPVWSRTMSMAELDEAERNAFLTWRENLAKLEADEQMLMTPYEKNLEVWRQLWRVLERADVVFQIVDARHPLLFRALDLEAYIRDLRPLKQHVLLINKADLLTDAQRGHWARYLTSQNVAHIFFSATLEIANQRDSPAPPAPLADSAPPQNDVPRVFSATDVLEEALRLCNVLREARQKETDSVVETSASHFTLGFVGYPNVGKSSTINALARSKRVAVSATPGKTKHFQTIALSESVTLCDCPGLVFPSVMSSRAEMVCHGLLRIAELREYEPAVRFVCARIPRRVFEARYVIRIPRPAAHEDATYAHEYHSSPLYLSSLSRAPTPAELLDALGFRRGFMTRHGEPDRARCARLVLADFLNGALLYAEPPPHVTLDEYAPQTGQSDDAIEEEREEDALDKSLDFALEMPETSASSVSPNAYSKPRRGRKAQRRAKEKLLTDGDTTGARLTGWRNKEAPVMNVRGGALPVSVKLARESSSSNQRATATKGDNETKKDEVTKL